MQKLRHSILQTPVQIIRDYILRKSDVFNGITDEQLIKHMNREIREVKIEKNLTLNGEIVAGYHQDKTIGINRDLVKRDRAGGGYTLTPAGTPTAVHELLHTMFALRNVIGANFIDEGFVEYKQVQGIQGAIEDGAKIPHFICYTPQTVVTKLLCETTGRDFADECAAEWDSDKFYNAISENKGDIIVLLATTRLIDKMFEIACDTERPVDERHVAWNKMDTATKNLIDNIAVNLFAKKRRNGKDAAESFDWLHNVKCDNCAYPADPEKYTRHLVDYAQNAVYNINND